MVAARGEAMLPVLHTGIAQGTVAQQDACIRALALIGTPTALQLLGEVARRTDGSLRHALWSSWQHTPAPGEYGRLVLVALPGEQKELILKREMEPLDVITLDGLQHTSTLTCLHLTGCTSVHNLAPLANVSQLKLLKLSECASVHDLGPLADLNRLRVLEMSRVDLSGAQLTNLSQ